MSLLVTADEAARFWAKVTKSEGCWEWTANRDRGGYGRFRTVDRRMVTSHRHAYEMMVGQIPTGLQLDHLCRNRACVNPAHLEPVTPLENTHRSMAPSNLKARASHCPKGHPFDETNTRIEIRNDGPHRICRTCYRAYRRERYRKRKASV